MNFYIPFGDKAAWLLLRRMSADCRPKGTAACWYFAPLFVWSGLSQIHMSARESAGRVNTQAKGRGRIMPARFRHSAGITANPRSGQSSACLLLTYQTSEDHIMTSPSLQSW